MEGSALRKLRGPGFGVCVVPVKLKSAVLFLTLIAITAFDASSLAQARPAICNVLERQLSASNGGGGNATRYARAAAAQSEQIQIARQQARGAGCGGGILSLFNPDPKPRSCSKILRTISRMEANRDALLRKRDALSGGGSSGSRRAILASLNLNNCNGARVTNAKAERKLPSAIQRGSDERASLFDEEVEDNPIRKSRKESAKEKKAVQKVSKAQNGAYIPMDANGTVRTLCVRTCDGFYFPVSFSTTKDRFSKDAAACTALCPGSEAKLYYHSIPDEEPEQMVDLTGKTYMSSANAFKYRVNGARSTPGCTCQAAETEAMSKPDPQELAAADAKKAKKAKKWLPNPGERPDLMTDAETMANLRGGLTFDQLRRLPWQVRRDGRDRQS